MNNENEIDFPKIGQEICINIMTDLIKKINELPLTDKNKVNFMLDVLGTCVGSVMQSSFIEKTINKTIDSFCDKIKGYCELNNEDDKDEKSH